VLWSRRLDRESLSRKREACEPPTRSLVVDLAASLLKVEFRTRRVVGLREVTAERLAHRSGSQRDRTAGRPCRPAANDVALLLGHNRRILVSNGAIDDVLGTTASNALTSVRLLAR